MPGPDSNSSEILDKPLKLMPKEFGEQQPVGNEKVTRTSREERISYAEDLLKSGQARIKLYHQFEELINQRDIVASLLTSVWMLPSPAIGNELPLQASTAHKASSTSLVVDLDLPNHRGRYDIVSKFIPNAQKAHLELEAFKKCLERDVPCVEPFGFLGIKQGQKEGGYSLTLFKQGIVPLSAIRLEGIRHMQGDQKVSRLLKSLGKFVADMHNKGIAHGDLHPGNIGLDTNQSSSESFILFDLEKSHFISPQKLLEKRSAATNANPNVNAGFREAEIDYLKDLAKITAFITEYNKEGFNGQNLLKTVLDAYLQGREKSKGQFSEEEFKSEFAKYYAQYKKTAEIAREQARETRELNKQS